MREKRPIRNEMKGKKKSPLGVTFWIALLVFLALLYTANRVDLTALFGESGVSGLVSRIFGGDYRGDPGERPREEEKTLVERRSEPVERSRSVRPPEPPPAAQPSPAAPPAAPEPASSSGGRTTAETSSNSLPSQTAPGASENRAPAAPPASSAPRADEARHNPPGAEGETPAAKTASGAAEPREKLQNRELYFVRLSDDGKVRLLPVTRPIPQGTMPLSRTLTALLDGPTRDEAQKGLVSLIPPGTSLQSASARDGVAYLSFNENLRFNSYGIEGFRGQLRQIVYTATEFPTVRKVQILIDGARVDYLSPEGLYIGKPLSREAL